MACRSEACLTFPALDATAEGYEVYVVADAVGGRQRGRGGGAGLSD